MLNRSSDDDSIEDKKAEELKLTCCAISLGYTNTDGRLQDWLLEPDRQKDIQRLSQEVYSWLIAPFESEFKGKIDTLARH